MTFNIGDKVRIIDSGDKYGIVGELYGCSLSLGESQNDYLVETIDGDLLHANKIELVNDSKKDDIMINNLTSINK